MESIQRCGDDKFGPQVTNCRGGFDFTLLFEECCLSIVPSALLLMALPFRYRSIWQKRAPRVASNVNYWAKLA